MMRLRLNLSTSLFINAFMNLQEAETVLIVEDHPMFVRALQALMSRHYPHIRSVVAPTCASAQAWLTETAPTSKLKAIFCDLNLPDAKGAHVLRQIKTLTSAPLLVISAEIEDSTVAEIESLGVMALVSKRSSVESLMEGMAKLLGAPQTSQPADLWDGLLSASQRKVAQQLINGLSNKEIAKALLLAPDTVKSHVSEIMLRMGARNRTEAVLKLTNRSQ